MNNGRSCPECGEIVEADLGCHTWPRTITREDGSRHEQWMSCMPCDSATIWSCETRWMDEDELRLLGKEKGHPIVPCDWTWTEGLNPGNPRYAENETRNPHWDFDEETIIKPIQVEILSVETIDWPNKKEGTSG